ncbi:MAG: RNA polymerase sigma factor [Bacteroidota bacterium]
MQEKEFISQLKKGDEKAFRTLVGSYGKMIFHTCFRIIQDKDDAQDIAQDVFVEAFQSVDKFMNQSAISTWLYRIAINKSLNFIKKHKKRTLTDDISKYGSADLSEKDASFKTENEERHLILSQAIDSLPESQKTAFVLHKIEEKSYKEIASLTGNSLSSVESLMHRAKNNLQKRLVSYYKGK